MKVFNKAGEMLELSDSVGKGGQGEVYVHELDGGKIAFKIFNKQALTPDLIAKIKFMVEMGDENDRELIRHPNIAWPQLAVYDEKNDFIGYAMRYKEGKPLDLLAHTQNYKRFFPDMDREKVARMLIDLWKAAGFLHERDIFIGDVNLRNIMCSPFSYEICLIDADSYQVKHWRCPVGRPEMTPPEHLDGRYEEIDRNRESDLFSLAILSFQCLMLGKHPYEHIGGGNPIENQKRGRMPYLKGCGAQPGNDGGVPLGPWYIYWNNYAHSTKKLFSNALKEGALDPNNRPSVSDWIQELEHYTKELNRPIAMHEGKLYWRAREMQPLSIKPKNLEKLDPRSAAAIKAVSVSQPSVASDSYGLDELIDNPTPRCPCILVLDDSEQMKGDGINSLHAGVQEFINKVYEDDFARFAIELSIFTFGGAVKRHREFSCQDAEQLGHFTAGGDALMGRALVQAMNELKNRQFEYSNEGISSYRPWLVLMTASDSADDCAPALKMLDNAPINIFVVGMGNCYNSALLEEIAPENLPAKQLQENKFSQFFSWLHQSMETVSRSVPGYKADLPPTNNWEE